MSAGRELSRAGLTAGQYQLSFWATGTPRVLADHVVQPVPAPVARRGGWALYQLRVPVTDTVGLSSPAGSVRVDEVRLHPVGSQLTSTTQQPLVGITSQTGPDGRTVFYEYDPLGRLQRVRDEQGRVVSENEYHYARP